MSNQRLYADVLLPLKITRAYTYIVPSDLKDQVALGKRVLVSFGKNKFYTGIITKLHSSYDETSSIKSIEEVLDIHPIVSEIQLEFWKWLSEYYMCSIGEVMDTALPNYFKLSSERFYRIHEHSSFNEDELEEDIAMLADAIRSMGQISLHELKAQFSHKKATFMLQVLIDKGIVEPVEIIQDRYVAKFEKYIELGSEYKEDKDKVNQLFTSLESKSPKQWKILIEYFSINSKRGEVKKSELLELSGSSSAILKSLLDKGILVEQSRQIDRYFLEDTKSNRQVLLSDIQTIAYNKLIENFNTYPINLLRGITGSGKTEIYIKWIQEGLKNGETVLYILPEIALTQQIVSRLSAYFGNQFLVYHSLISANKKYELWNRVASGNVKFIIGTRSSIFLPFQKLDRIIIDEEHDNSLKQLDAHPKFHARDSIIHYSQRFKSKILLGSATPSIESYFNVQDGKYGYVELLERFGNAKLPEVKVLNLKDAEVEKTMKSHYSEILLSEIEKRTNRGEQSILFQNRRGYSPYIQCNTCGHIPKCSQCDVSLTFHSFHHVLICHYCNKKYPMPKICSECKSPNIRTKGLGTQKVEEEIHLFLPDISITRLDTDVARSSNKIDQLLEDFKNKKYDLLIGTQMVSKGLDFENLTLVGVVQADIFFSFIDYRSDEKAFQVLSQVCGRVGRGEKPGLVIIQTYQPEHRVLRYVLSQNWTEFIQEELSHRKEFIYPPYCRMLKIDIRHIKQDLVDIYSNKIAAKIKEKISSQVLGPTTPPISRIRNQYIKEIFIKLPRNKELQMNKSLIKEIIDSELITLPNKNFSIDIVVDV